MANSPHSKNLTFLAFQRFQQPANIDQDQINTLRTLVQSTRSEFNKDLLTSAVTELATAVDEQQLWLDNMRQQKDQLAARVQRLRTVRDQLRSGRK